jgi:hypothetical protein
MLETIILICAIFSLSFLLKESAGPWGMMSWLRHQLFSSPYVGVFFYKLFDCYFCLGCHAGWIIYLLSQPVWSLPMLICWSLAGGTICLLFDKILKGAL